VQNYQESLAIREQLGYQAGYAQVKARVETASGKLS